MSINGWQDKEQVVYVYYEILFSLQKRMKCLLQQNGFNCRDVKY